MHILKMYYYDLKYILKNIHQRRWQVTTRIVFQRKNRCLPLFGIKKITKLHLVMLQGE